MGDEAVKIFLNAAGTEDDVSENMKAFLSYLIEQKVKNPFTKKLDEEVKKARRSKKWRAEFMTLEMKYREIRKETLIAGKAEDILEFLEELGEIPTDLKDEVLQERNIKVLKSWLKLAAKADSIEDFQAKMQSK